MRIFGVVLLISLFVTGAFAEPLRPGYPAGTRVARGGAHNTAVMIGVGAVILAGVGILISGNSSAVSSLQISSQGVVVPPTIIAVTTSTTSTTSSTGTP
jgi:hypothetical protein